jgi:hypothetical protein
MDITFESTCYLTSDIKSLIEMFPKIGDKYTYNIINRIIDEDDFLYCYIYDPENHKDYESDDRGWMSQLYMRIEMPSNVEDVIIFTEYNTSSPLALWLSNNILDDDDDDE